MFAFQRNHEGASVLHGGPNIVTKSGVFEKCKMGAEEAEKKQFHIGRPFI